MIVSLKRQCLKVIQAVAIRKETVVMPCLWNMRYGEGTGTFEYPGITESSYLVNHPAASRVSIGQNKCHCEESPPMGGDNVAVS